MQRLKCPFAIAALLVAAISQTLSAEEYVQLTPAWAKQNPGKLTMSMGTAIGGWDGYLFKLHFDTPKVYSVTSTVLLKRENEQGELALHSFTWTARERTKVIPINIRTPSYAPRYESDEGIVARADAKLSIMVRHLDSAGNPTGAHEDYYLTLSDFDGAHTMPELQEDRTHTKPESDDGG